MENAKAQSTQNMIAKASQKLVMQRDTSSLLAALYEACSEIVPLSSIYLLTPQTPSQSGCVQTLSMHDGQTTLTKIFLLEADASWLKPEQIHLDGAALQNRYPPEALTESYEGVIDYLHIPLTIQDKQLGCLEFIRKTPPAFDEQEVQILASLAKCSAFALANIMEITSLRQQTKRLEQEYRHSSILVDVTNTAISTLEIKSMVPEIAKEIHRFFDIGFIGLALYNSTDEKRTFNLSCCEFHANNLLQNSLENIDASYPLFQQAIQIKNARVISSNQIAPYGENDTLLPLVTHNGRQFLCLLPLVFGPNQHGAIWLAHDKADIFSPDNVELLSQIASRVAIAVHNALDYEAVREIKETLVNENLYLAEQIQSADTFGEIIGNSYAIRHVLEQVEMVANSDCTVLILGETGTGKELFARAIHNRSNRNNKRMVKMNCAAVPSGLLESELFGHEKGAFTGATAQRMGRFELANGSTLLLDEVGDIPLELQPKLLRVLQEREIERLGGTKIIPIDVRLIAATNRNLGKMVEDNTYRADLFYRLNVFPIIIPPLRDRVEDIPLLAQFFTQKLAKQMKRHIDRIPADAMRHLCEHYWPGNVRELANIIERAVILTSGSTLNLSPKDLLPSTQYRHTNSFITTPPKKIEKPVKPSYSAPIHTDEKAEQNENEKRRIINALRESNGVVAGTRGAAIKLGLKRTTLLSRMQRLGISVQDALDQDISLD